MQVISVINYKGGVGKTTITANLACGLARKGRRVLLLDMDAQASLTFSFVTPDYWDSNLKENKTIKNWFDCISEGSSTKSLSDFVIKPPKINALLHRTGSSGSVHLISSHLGLINVDLELATLLGGASLSQAQKNYIKVHGKLRVEIQNIAREDYDIVLIDCPPNFNIVTKNALIASDKILIPAKPDYLSTLGIDYLQRSVKKLVKDFNEYASLDANTEEVAPESLGIVFTMMQIYRGQPIAAQRQYVAQTKRLDLNIPVMDSIFRENKSIFSEAHQNGLPVVVNAYSNNTHAKVVKEIEAFVDEFIDKIGI